MYINLNEMQMLPYSSVPAESTLGHMRYQSECSGKIARNNYAGSSENSLLADVIHIKLPRAVTHAKL